MWGLRSGGHWIRVDIGELMVGLRAMEWHGMGQGETKHNFVTALPI